MHIGFLGPLPPLRGGIAQHSARLVEALRSLGHDVTAVSWAAQYPKQLYPGEERDPEAAAVAGARYTMRWYDPTSWWRAGRRLRRCDVLVFPWVTPFQAPMYRVARLAARGVPAVSVVHNLVPHEPTRVDRALTRVGLGGIRGAVVHASEVAEQVNTRFPPTEVRLVHHPPNLPLHPTPLPPGPPWRALFLGFVRPYKGLDIALDALASLRRGGVDIDLTVAGQIWGPAEPWRRQIEALDLDDHIDLRARYLPDREVAAALETHHLVVAPYRSATQSGIVPLAYAAGRPVVATAVGGLSDVVTEGLTGTLAPPDDPAAFAAAVERALDRLPDLAEGAAGSELVTTWEDVARCVIEAAG